jgi:hypothetical protein
METPVEQTLASDPAELFNFLSFMTDDQRQAIFLPTFKFTSNVSRVLLFARPGRGNTDEVLRLQSLQQHQAD